VWGWGQDVQILEPPRQVAAVIAPQGRIGLNPGYSLGASRKLVDASRITSPGWQARTVLKEGVHKTYAWVCRRP
jgi:GDP-L-fucose synthase